MTYFALNNSQPLPPTIKLWIDDPYLTQGKATVLHTQDDLLVIDQTVFYAEGGGQMCDIGIIQSTNTKETAKVIDVQKQPGKCLFIKREDNIKVPPVQVDTVVVHKLNQPSPFKVGETVEMTIDWDYRYKLMRGHSAAHFVFHAIEQIYGSHDQLKLSGCFIDEKGARFSYGNKLDPQRLPEVAEIANELIRQGNEILMESDPQTHEISYWRYNDIIIPCGGTHVLNATEIGEISLKRKSQGKNSDRIYVLLSETI